MTHISAGCAVCVCVGGGAHCDEIPFSITLENIELISDTDPFTQLIDYLFIYMVCCLIN